MHLFKYFITKTGFVIRSADVSLINPIINTVTQYSIFVNRAYDPNLQETAWSAANMNANDKIDIQFPSIYELSNTYTCATTI